MTKFVMGFMSILKRIQKLKYVLFGYCMNKL
jgi:hypothetical protein